MGTLLNVGTLTVSDNAIKNSVRFHAKDNSKKAPVTGGKE
jgi:hypothetical protein